MPLQVLIADEQPLFREALALAVARAFVGALVTEADSTESLFDALARNRKFDLVLLDVELPGAQSFSALVQVRAAFSAVPIVVISGRKEHGIVSRAVAHGASGFIPKRFGVDTLRDAVLKVMDGDVWIPPDVDLSSAADPEMTRLRDRLVTLTPQQVRVLMMLSQGLLNKQIAYELGVSEATIKAHVSAILQKLGVESRTQAVIAAAKIAGSQWRPGA